MLREHRAFGAYWVSRVLATTAYQMQIVAVGWQMYELTHSALALGCVGLVQFLPSILLVLVTGQVADRFDRRRIVAICRFVHGSAVGVLLLANAMGWISAPVIFMVVFVIGISKAFEMPGQSALVPSLVPLERLSNAFAWSASAGEFATIIGPAAGGLLYLAGASVVYGTCVALFAVSGFFVLGLYRLLSPELLARLATGREAILNQPPARSKESLLAGIRFIRGQQIVFGAISLDMFSVLFGGATALLPIFAADILGTGPWGLGMLRSAPAVGALTMAVWLARHPLHRNAGRIMFAAVALFGVATIVFGLSRSLPLSLGALVVLGASDMVSVVMRSTLVQLETPDPMRGRVSAVNSLFIGTSNQVGEFESGVTAALFGASPAAVIGGVATIAIVALWVRWFPALYAVDGLHPKEG